MAIKELQYHIHELVSSIDICRKDRKLTPSLILLYSTIDIMAWLDRDENHNDVRRSDFIKWVETYLLPNYLFSCTALDLYAARCAIIHSYSSESSLSRNGEANMIFYTWGTATNENLQNHIYHIGCSNIRTIHIDKLFYALKDGTNKFLLNNQHNKIVLERSKKFLTMIELNPKN